MKLLLMLILFVGISFSQTKTIQKNKAETVLNQTSDFAIFRKAGSDYVYDLYMVKVIGQDTTNVLLASDRTVKPSDLTQIEKDTLDGIIK